MQRHININLSLKRKDLPRRRRNLRQSLKGMQLFIAETFKYFLFHFSPDMCDEREALCKSPSLLREQSISAQLSLMFIYKSFIKTVVVKCATVICRTLPPFAAGSLTLC